MRRLALSFASLVLLAACGSSSKPGSDADAGPVATGIVAQRPYTLVVPDSYDPSKPTPLVFMAHGYGVDGALEEMAVMQLATTAQKHGFLYAYADGTVDHTGKRFWNATDACCNFDALPVDDVAYFDAIVDDVASKYNLDRARVYVIGHSNGGFMAHRYACERASRVAAIVSLAGAQWADASKCTPSEPVAVAQVHGDADDTINYAGGSIDGHPYPSAHDTVATWAAKEGCAQPLAAAGTLDLDTTLAGSETTIERYGGCVANGDVELWTIHGAGHVPSFDAKWGEAVWSFFQAHAKGASAPASSSSR